MDANDAVLLSSIVTAIATLTLAAITAYYAWHTRRMAEAMARQIVPDFHISDASVKIFPNGHTNNAQIFAVILSATVCNRNSAGGTIETPRVFFKFKDGTEVRAELTGSDGSIHLVGGAMEIVHSQCRWVETSDLAKELMTNAEIRISCRDNLGRDCGAGIPVRRRASTRG